MSYTFYKGKSLLVKREDRELQVLYYYETHESSLVKRVIGQIFICVSLGPNFVALRKGDKILSLWNIYCVCSILFIIIGLWCPEGHFFFVSPRNWRQQNKVNFLAQLWALVLSTLPFFLYVEKYKFGFVLFIVHELVSKSANAVRFFLRKDYIEGNLKISITKFNFDKKKID